LDALLRDDKYILGEVETYAAQCGYGPLQTCTFITACREQKQLCCMFFFLPFSSFFMFICIPWVSAHWHHYPDGKLQRGVLEPHSDCQTCYEIYIPNDLEAHPEVIIISRNPHSHPDPRPTRTPGVIKRLFTSLVEDTGWRLADMTPRKLSIDSGFLANFRLKLNWKRAEDPPLSALHPSLGNFDHTLRLIEKLHEIHFPDGTGLDGMNFFFVFIHSLFFYMIMNRSIYIVSQASRASQR